jgi:peptide deformylase
MPVRQIISYPNHILSTIGECVNVFDDSLKCLTDDMFETMYAARGVGLAASQVGIPLRLFVADCENVKIVAANPEIIETSGSQNEEEGCLSINGIYYPLIRPQRDLLRAQNLQGEAYEIEGQHFLARCLLHETDHCDGKLFISHLTPLQRDIVIRKFNKLNRKRS